MRFSIVILPRQIPDSGTLSLAPVGVVEHHIVWIALHYAPEGSPLSIELGKVEFGAHGQGAVANEGPAYTAPSARFRVKLAKSGTLHAVAYCNIHGLWTSSTDIAMR